MRIREEDGLSVHRDGVSLESVHEILMRNYAAYQCLKMKPKNSHSLAKPSNPKPSS
jgi:hypothetical protein